MSDAFVVEGDSEEGSSAVGTTDDHLADAQPDEETSQAVLEDDRELTEAIREFLADGDFIIIALIEEFPDESAAAAGEHSEVDAEGMEAEELEGGLGEAYEAYDEEYEDAIELDDADASEEEQTEGEGVADTRSSGTVKGPLFLLLEVRFVEDGESSVDKSSAE